MLLLRSHRVEAGLAHLAHTVRADGDLSVTGVPADELARRRSGLVDLPWYSTHQVHGDRVVAIGPRTQWCDRRRDSAGPDADAITTSDTSTVVAVQSGDCVPIGFVHEGGAIGVAHGGWRGLEAGVIESTVRSLRDHAGSGTIRAAVGPHIRADRYEFGGVELGRLANRFGDDVVAETRDRRPALDLTAVVSAELDRVGVHDVFWSSDCTAADPDRYWSHRARGETGRIALIAWIEPQ